LQTNLILTYSDANGNSVSDSRTLNVATSNPAAFLFQQSSYFQTFPLALNADGTINCLGNPAAVGSVVTIFLEGLGVTSPTPITGLVNTGPSVPLSLPVVVTPYCRAHCVIPYLPLSPQARWLARFPA
jgi:uncharacterized protein (TIGR03437 family)